MDIIYRDCTTEEFEAVYRDDYPDKDLCPDFVAARNVSHIYGAEVDGKIRGAIAFEFAAYEPIDDEGHDLTLSYLNFQYVSRAYRKNGIGTSLLTYAIKFLIAEDRIPIGCGFTSRKMKSCFEALSPELKQSVVLLPTILDDGQDIWEECDL